MSEHGIRSLVQAYLNCKVCGTRRRCWNPFSPHFGQLVHRVLKRHRGKNVPLPERYWELTTQRLDDYLVQLPKETE